MQSRASSISARVSQFQATKGVCRPSLRSKVVQNDFAVGAVFEVREAGSELRGAPREEAPLPASPRAPSERRERTHREEARRWHPNTTSRTGRSAACSRHRARGLRGCRGARSRPAPLAVAGRGRGAPAPGCPNCVWLRCRGEECAHRAAPSLRFRRAQNARAELYLPARLRVAAVPEQQLRGLVQPLELFQNP